MNKDKNLTRINVLMATTLAIGALASFFGGYNGENSRTEKARFLANCPGDQNILFSKRNDHRTDLTCADDGSAPRIIPMSKEWNDDDAQELINKVVLNYPGRVMLELAVNANGERITTESNTGFSIEDNPYSPSSITVQSPLEDITTYTPNLLD